ncbi:hypothetical protein AMATHDRAFT_145197 [Amanita thiersii Skay4041]|uniref:Uncharacterized protein n=1 Tax=Amanita thiersii Skay4041 TaxID=703135 RepID=A0A2A9NQ68_9AGAR|nr:hypothetical protein AMATHDRAFT_145197 [Amanita thiersii Skay4041]
MADRSTSQQGKWNRCGLCRESKALLYLNHLDLVLRNDSTYAGDLLHQLYLDSFADTSDTIRMALLAPQTVKGVRSKWYGAGGSSTLGFSKLPTIGIIPQPDYLWTAMSDGGWSKLDLDVAIEQINVILRLITSLDENYIKGIL